MSKLLSRDELIQVTSDLPWEDVHLRKPPHGEIVGTIRLVGLTGEEVNEWQDQAVQRKGKVTRQSRHTMALLIVASAIDEDGTKLFGKADVMRVSQMAGYALMQLTEVALKLSGLGDDDDARELVENFDDGPSDSDTSD